MPFRKTGRMFLVSSASGLSSNTKAYRQVSRHIYQKSRQVKPPTEIKFDDLILVIGEPARPIFLRNHKPLQVTMLRRAHGCDLADASSDERSEEGK